MRTVFALVASIISLCIPMQSQATLLTRDFFIFGHPTGSLTSFSVQLTFDDSKTSYDPVRDSIEILTDISITPGLDLGGLDFSTPCFSYDTHTSVPLLTIGTPGGACSGLSGNWPYQAKEGDWRVVIISPATIEGSVDQTTAIPNGSFSVFQNGKLSISRDLNITAETISGVPEPSTWTMMIAGFFMVGGAIRARRIFDPMRAGS